MMDAETVLFEQHPLYKKMMMQAVFVKVTRITKKSTRVRHDITYAYNSQRRHSAEIKFKGGIEVDNGEYHLIYSTRHELGKFELYTHDRIGLNEILLEEITRDEYMRQLENKAIFYRVWMNYSQDEHPYVKIMQESYHFGNLVRRWKQIREHQRESIENGKVTIEEARELFENYEYNKGKVAELRRTAGEMMARRLGEVGIT